MSRNRMLFLGRWTRGWVTGLALAAALIVPGCSKNSGGGGGNNNQNQNTNLPACPEGTEAQGEACVPLWDTCTAVDEIPVLGGGCRAVGVDRCEGGAGCAAGFAGDGQGGCDPIRPPDPCAAGTFGLLGSTTCEALRECGSAPWGNVSAAVGAVYVDAAYGGGASDGTEARPFTTIGAGVAAASSGGQVVVAAGTYQESLSLVRPVTISGRCPELVTIQGVNQGGQNQPAVTISAPASGTTLEGLRLTGPGHGVVLNEAVDVRLREVEVLDPDGYGLLLQRGSTASLRRVKVQGAATAGVILFGGQIQVTDTVVRDTDPSSAGAFGRGVDLGCDYQGSGGCASLDATGLVVERSHEAGVYLAGGSASLSGCLVADTKANAIHGQAGIGIQAQCDTTSADCPTVTVVGSVVSGNRASGIMALGTDLQIMDTVVRDTLPQSADDRLGNGLVAQCDPSLILCAPVVLSCSVFERNHQAGLALVGVTAQLEGVIIRDTEAQMSNDRAGDGLLAQCEPVSAECADATLTDVSVRGNTSSGIFVHGATVRLQGVLVAENRPGAANQTEGLAIYAQCENTVGSCADLEVDASLLLDHHAEGVALFGGSARFTRSTVLGVAPQASDGEYGFGIYVDGSSDVATLDASACEIGDAALAGVFYVESAGSIARSWVHGGEYSVILSSADGVTLENNVLEGTKQSAPLIQ